MLAVALAFTSAAFADQWPVLVDTPEQSVEGKPKSMHFSTDVQKGLMASIDTRVLDKASKQVTFVQFSVRLSECLEEKGHLTISGIDGSNSNEQAYLFGGNNYVSFMAENLCKAALDSLKEAGKTPT